MPAFSSKSLVAASIKMGSATFLSRILGLVREQVFAFFFGASGLTDAFQVAYRIPNMLRDLFAEGAFSSAFVPVLTETKQESDDQARHLIGGLSLLLLLMTAFFSTLIIFWAPELVELFAPSFKADAQQLRVTITLTRMMAPFLCLISLSALFMGALNTRKVFLLPALTPALFNIVMIFSIAFFSGVLKGKGFEPIYALGFGVLFGGALQASVQLLALIKNHFSPKFAWKQLWNERVKKVFRLLGPGLLGFSATQVNLLVATILATNAALGAATWLSYAFRLFQFPIGVASVSLGNSHLVYFSESWKQGTAEAKERALGTLRESYRLSMLVMLPAAVLFFFMAEDFVRLLFERGRFGVNDTAMVTLALKYYALGLPFYGLYKIWVPTFYTLDRQKIPVLCSVFSIAFNIIFCWFLTPRYGFFILALGTTLSMLINVLMQSTFLLFSLKLPLQFLAGKTFGKGLLAAFFMGLSLVVFQHFFLWGKVGFSSQISRVALGLLCAVFSYIGALLFLGERKRLKKLLRFK